MKQTMYCIAGTCKYAYRPLCHSVADQNGTNVQKGKGGSRLKVVHCSSLHRCVGTASSSASIQRVCVQGYDPALASKTLGSPPVPVQQHVLTGAAAEPDEKAALLIALVRTWCVCIWLSVTMYVGVVCGSSHATSI